MRTGILGGAFNPPHIGHLVCAQEAMAELELDEVVLVPFGRPPHRELEDDPGAQLRVEMCERAVASEPRMSVSRAEAERTGPSYTVDTLRDWPRGAELYLILGGDQAAALGKWREPEEVMRLARLAVAERAGFDEERVRASLAGLSGAHTARFFAMPRIDVSSSAVRRRLARGLPIRYLVPDPVVELIEERSLYAAAVAG